MKLSLSPCAVVVGALSLSSFARAQTVSDSHAAPADPAAVTPAAPPPVGSTPSSPTVAPEAAASPVSPVPGSGAAPDAARGVLGETCRASTDCGAGLTCVSEVCRATNEGKACGARADCGAPLACFDHVCVVHDGARAREAAASPATDDAATALAAALESPRSVSVDEAFYAWSGSLWYSPAVTTASAAERAHGIVNHGYSVLASSTTIDGSYRLPAVLFEATIPFVVASTSYNGVNDTEAAIGNLALGVFWARELGPFALRLGGTFTLPAGTQSFGSKYALALAAGTRGRDRQWLWAGDRFTIAPTVRFSSTTTRGFQHATEVVAAPLATMSNNETSTLIVQASEDVGAQFDLYQFGLRGEIVVDTDRQSDLVQTSLYPYVGLRDPRWFANIGLLMNIDKPLGFAFDEYGVWGVRLRAGARF